MKTIYKSAITSKEFYDRSEWIDYDNIRASCFVFLVFLPEWKTIIKQNLIETAHTLFTPFLENIVTSLVEPHFNALEGGWGDFCMDTWNIHEDTYDYALEGKSIASAKYLQMLQDSKIEVNYDGLGYCKDWDPFWDCILDCIVSHDAPLSNFHFHDLNHQFYFYFHHTKSIGLVYKEFNDAIKYVLQQSKTANLEIWDWNDEKNLDKIRGEINYMGKDYWLHRKDMGMMQD